MSSARILRGFACGALVALSCTPAPTRDASAEAASDDALEAASDDALEAASDDALEAALEAGRWLAASARDTPAGVTWPADPEDPESAGPDLYSGAAGIVPVLFVLGALDRTEGFPDWNHLARRGADELLATVDQLDDAGLYTGLAGVGFALLEAHRRTGDARYERGVRRAVARLAAPELAHRVGSGVEWSEVTDIVAGGAGVGLFLLQADARLDLPDARELARQAGDRLLELAERTDAGLRWQMSPDYPREMPNFSHGTAGIAYFLAALHATTGDDRYLEGALGGARYLLSIADTEGGLCLIYHHAPDGRDLHYLSWCHGPAGTARLFYRLWQITGDEEWMEWVRRSAAAVRASGVPQRRTPGFWNNVSQCCGSAGLVDFFLSLHRVTGDPADLEFARQVADDLLDRAEETPSGLRWVQAEHRVRPDLLVAQTGYMQGAAGVAHALLRLGRIGKGGDTTLRLPDDPWTLAAADAQTEP